MISISKAITIIQRESISLGTERIPLADAVGRILAEDIIADSDLPPFDRSQMDGYAVKADDTAATPAALKIVGESAAGSGWHKTLGRGEAVRIMTGAPVPAGADAVQKLELAREENGSVIISEPTAQDRFIVRKGTEIKKGAAVLKKGEQLNAANIAVPAAFGYAKVRVSRRPRVVIFSTGTEIIEINKRPKRDQIRNSNSLMLAALCREAGADPLVYPIIGDNVSDLRSQISVAVKKADILITTGGVSVGKYDLTKLALSELGAEIYFDKVALKPGKPTVFGKLKKAYIFGLPGNPVSAAVTFHLFVRLLFKKLQAASAASLDVGRAVCLDSVRPNTERDTYLPAKLFASHEPQTEVKPLPWHGSSDFISLARANALIFVPKGRLVSVGDKVEIVRL
jgi:molybdopterin molybdotransferase